MKHIGDVTKVDGSQVEPVWCITFGSPCQDLSVAGKRAGLAGERSGLFLHAVRIIKEMRSEPRKICSGGTDEYIRLPRYSILENVPGMFSSNSGEDFRCVLEELARVKQADAVIPRSFDKKGRPERWPHAGYIVGDDWSIAWRTMDAQYWGVPQRRKRVCVLCDYDGLTAPEILLCDSVQRVGNADTFCGEPVVMDLGNGCRREVQPVGESMSGNIEPCIPSWKGIARDPAQSTEGCDQQSSYTLQVRCGCDGGAKEH